MPPTTNDTSLGRLVYEVGQIWRFRIDSKLQDFNLSRAKLHVIMALLESSEEGISQGQLAKICNVEPPSMAGLLDRMEKEGWVRRVPSPTDRRCKLTLLNDKARKIYHQIAEASEQVEAEVFEKLSKDSYRQVKRSLTALLEALEKTGTSSAKGVSA